MKTPDPYPQNPYPLPTGRVGVGLADPRVTRDNPYLPPTTPEARKYFFTKIREFSEVATADKKKKVNFEAFAQEWNRTADGKERFYVTFEVLSAYSKSWEKANNVRASQELMSGQLQEVKKTAEIFLANGKPFPPYLTTDSSQIQLVNATGFQTRAGQDDG